MHSDIQRRNQIRWIRRIWNERNISFQVIVEGHDDRQAYKRLLVSEKLKYFPCDGRIEVDFNPNNDSRESYGDSGKSHVVKVIEKLKEECAKNNHPENFFLAIVDRDFDGVVNKKNLENEYLGNIIYTDGTDLESMIFFTYYQKKQKKLDEVFERFISSEFIGNKIKFTLSVAREISAIMIESQKKEYHLPISSYFENPKRFEGLVNFESEAFDLDKFLKNLEAIRKSRSKKTKQYSDTDLIKSASKLLSSKRHPQKFIIHGKTLFRILDFATKKIAIGHKKISLELQKNFTTKLFESTSTHRKISEKLVQSPVFN